MSDISRQRGIKSSVGPAANEDDRGSSADSDTRFRSALASLQTTGTTTPFGPKGAAVVSAAVSGLGGVSDAGTVGSNATVLAGSTGTAATGGAVRAGGSLGNVQQMAAGGDRSAQMMMATREMQELNQMFNLQYLQLQQKIQGENRQFSALSNVMKTKHDTAKNALNNLK